MRALKRVCVAFEKNLQTPTSGINQIFQSLMCDSSILDMV